MTYEYIEFFKYFFSSSLWYFAIPVSDNQPVKFGELCLHNASWSTNDQICTKYRDVCVKIEAFYLLTHQNSLSRDACMEFVEYLLLNCYTCQSSLTSQLLIRQEEKSKKISEYSGCWNLKLLQSGVHFWLCLFTISWEAWAAM